MARIVFVFSLFLTSCTLSIESENTEKQKVIVQDTVLVLSSPDSYRETEDTVLENNDPASLDLTQHQLFIDTTRNSHFYDAIEVWTLSEDQLKQVEELLEEINKDFTPKTLVGHSFPTQFQRLRKLNGEYVLYHSCDGTDLRFMLREKSLIIFGLVEPDAYSVANLIRSNAQKLEVELRVYPTPETGHNLHMIIERMNDSVYRLSTDHEGILSDIYYLTPIEKIHCFNLVVNHCPDRKRMEYTGFDSE